jgi:hypothetical protein
VQFKRIKVEKNKDGYIYCDGKTNNKTWKGAHLTINWKIENPQWPSEKFTRLTEKML